MKTRVLHVYPELNCGGTEMVFYNLIKFGDRHKFIYEILVQRPGDNEEIFKDIDCKIHTVEFKNKGQYFNALVRFFKNGKFDVVHAHMDTKLPLVLKAAREAGINCRVAHSHNARVDIPQFTWPLFFLRHRKYERYATELFGCSKLALKWLFPTSWRKGHVINNGIDLDKFKFNAETRDKIRKENGISETTKVFINVGRCTDQKNQKYILNIAASRQNNNELYVIVGNGPLLNELEKQKTEYNLDNVWLLGKRDDVADWLCASDVFLFPSVYEGLGIVAIEAEASGLLVIATDTIPPEANMHVGNFQSSSLKDIKRWNELMDRPPFSDDERTHLSTKAFSSDYNIRTVTHNVEAIYSKSQ